LWLKLAFVVEGPDAAMAIARKALEAVEPSKGILQVYQNYAAILASRGRDDEALALCLEGAHVTLGSGREGRLIEEASAFAAAMPTNAELVRVRDWAAAQEGLEVNVALADILLNERAGDWLGGAERARIARRRHPKYIHSALHEAFCWLGANEPEKAQFALDEFPIPWRFEARDSVTWLAAFVAMRYGDVARGRDLAATYLGVAVSFSQEAVEARLLREWDTRVGRLGEANPALEFPILPPTFSGLSTPVIRPQHGPPVLQQHRDETGAVRSASSGRLRVLAVATEWSSGQGGLSTFNRQLCCALSTAGVDVTCIAIAPSREEVAQAGMMGVHLVAARATPSVDQREWLARRPAGLEEYRPDFIIGHGRVTGPAALRLADDVFPGSRRLHFVHMAPDEIEWHKLDREQPAGLRAEDRTQQELDLGRGADRVIAVGPRLQERYARELYSYGAPPPVRFDPGFDAAEESVSSPPLGKPWKILLLGRAEDHELKGLDLAARAIGRVTHRRDKTLPGIEFVVRGAKPEDVDLLRCSLRTWAASPRLDVTVRSYTAIETTLQRDMRSASLVLMPSRREGFGLVGVEAIASGIPVLITSASGLAEMLTEILSPVEAARIIVETSGDTNYSDMDVEEWERSIYASLYDREAAFRAASDLRNKLRLRYSWKGSVEGLLSALTPP
jgi:glycosyltransferase involved in cell wall biosynthesis